MWQRDRSQPYPDAEEGTRRGAPSAFHVRAVPYVNCQESNTFFALSTNASSFSGVVTKIS